MTWLRRKQRDDQTETAARKAVEDGRRRLREAENRRPRVERAGDQLSYIVGQALRGGT